MQQCCAAQRSSWAPSRLAAQAAARRCRAAAARRPTVCSAGGSELKLFSPSKVGAGGALLGGPKGAAATVFRLCCCSQRATTLRRSGARTPLNPSCPPLSPQINIFLRIVRRREDGYHDLASLFHVIDLGDDMRFEELPAGASEDVLTCDMPGGQTPWCRRRHWRAMTSEADQGAKS